MHQCEDSCLRDRNRKTPNLSINANGVVAVAFFGMATVIQISLMVTSMTRANLPTLAPRAERSFICLKWTIHARSRHGNAQGWTATTTGKIPLQPRVRRVLGLGPQINELGKFGKSNGIEWHRWRD